jgi:Fe-S-cluster containining protein
VDRLDPEIFRLTYFHHCMDCTFCHDSCCQYGADTELPRVQALERYQAELEAYLGLPRSEWFREDPTDLGYIDEPEYPGGQYTRTRVRDGACVFVDRNGRGCRIHRFCLERGIDVHDLKPMVCLMFPVLFAQGRLEPAIELTDGSLACLGAGPTIYRSSRADLGYYFGPELIAELDAIEAAVYRQRPAGSGLSLPVV